MEKKEAYKEINKEYWKIWRGFMGIRFNYGLFGRYVGKSKLNEEDEKKLRAAEGRLIHLAQILDEDGQDHSDHLRGELYTTRFKIEKYLARKGNSK